MEDDHSRLKVENKNLVNSIFTLFTNLIGADNENPKYCVELAKSLHLNEFSVGSVNNLSYSVRRIIKGLGSSRLYSQCGCFASLSCLLKYQECTVEDILHALEKEQQSAQGISKAETVAQNAACLLACGAIIHSGMFFLQPPEVKQLILKKLIDAGGKKTYFSVVTYKFVMEIVQSVNEEDFKNIVWSVCKSELLTSENEYNFDQLQLLMTCIIKSPNKLEKWLQKTSSSVELTLEKTIEFLGNNLVKNDHPIYEIVSQFLCQNIKYLPAYWQKFINKKDAKNNFCKDKLVILFFHLIKHLNDGKIVPTLLHPEFVKIMVKVLSAKKKKLKEEGDYFKKAKSALILMLNLANSEATSQEVRFEIIMKLLLHPTNLKFDMKTGLKCVHSLISHLNLHFVMKLIKILQKIIIGKLKKVVNEEGDLIEWSIREKELALNFLVKIINHSATSNHYDVKIDQIKFIFEQAFFKNKSVLDVRELARESFYKSIILQMPSLKDLLLLLDELAIYVNDCLKNKDLEVEDEVVEIWEKHFIVIQKLMKKSNKKLFISVHVLLIYMGLQLFVDKDLAKSGIEELLACYYRLNKIHTKKSVSEIKKDNISINGDPHWTEVVTDLILSLLSRENKLWRHVVSCIFTQIVIYATPTALHQIIEALEMTTESDTLEPLEADEVEEEDENGTCEYNNSRVQEEQNSEDDNTTENKNNECLKMALHNALNGSASFSDNESVDMDQMDSDEEKKLNDNLSAAFKLFKKEAQGKKKRKKLTKHEEALSHFKLRVLDLVEIYIKNNPTLGGCLDLIRILFDILEFSIKDPHQRFLQSRVDSILKQICNVKSFTDLSDIKEKIIRKAFKMILDKKEISTAAFIEISPRISDCLVFLVRCSQLLPSEEEMPLLANECNTLLKTLFLSRDSKFTYGIFEKLLNIKWKGNFVIVKTLFELLTAPELRIFKRMKVLELLKIFYKNDNFHISSEESIKQELNLIEENFIENFISFLREFENDTENTNLKQYISFFSNILNFINIIYSRGKKSLLLQNNSSWKILITAMAQINAINSNRKTRSQLANLVRLFNIETNSAKVNVNGRLLKRTSSETQISKYADIEPKPKKKKISALNSILKKKVV